MRAGRRALLALAAVSLIVAVIVAAGGGVRASAGGLRLSAQSPGPAALLAIFALAGWAALARRDAAADLAGAWPAVDRRATWIIASVAGLSGAAAILFNSFAASGADASGYLSQGALWASGRLLLPDLLAQQASWPAGAAATVPLGWRVAMAPGFQAPTYPPGLSLLMAVPYALAGTLGASLVVPIAASLATLATGAVARVMAGGAAGILAALLIAVSPAFVYQSFQPMSDVPVTAAWMLAWWLIARERPLAAGVAAAVAILIRPNLAPVAIVPALALAAEGWKGIRSFAFPVVLAGAAIAVLQWHWYGSPLTSGYGPAGAIFSAANVWPNAKAYAAWLLETQPVLFLAPLVLPGAARWFPIAFIAAVVSCYLIYGVFETWDYLRFLLPAMAMAAVLVGLLGARLIDALPAVWRVPGLLALALVIVAQGMLAARSHDVTGAADRQRRIAQAGPYLASALPPGAVIIAGEQSGAARHYTGHDVLRWEAIAPADLGAALTWLEAQRRPVWWMLDQWEEPLVRAKFGGVAAAALDWPPIMEAGPARTTRAWRPADRAGFQRGERTATDRLR